MTRAFHVEYRRESLPALLEQADSLAVLSFGDAGKATSDPRHLHIPLPVRSAAAPHECWRVDAAVAVGTDGELCWSAGGGWRFVAIALDEARRGGIEAASAHAYDSLLRHVESVPEKHLQRVWNYLGAINAGDNDEERYRLFCNGRARGLSANGVIRYPAATAIGHHRSPSLLQIYALCATEPGHALENPRQVSAWRYPRQYGPTAPSFARAMRLPNAALAISGTAAVTGHASRHHDDVNAQIDEAFANLRTLLKRAGLSAFDARSLLKVYVRNAEDADVVETALASHLDESVPRVLLQGDICRRELLVEIDGWSNLPGLQTARS